MFQIVLIIGIIYNTLEIAFIISDNKSEIIWSCYFLSLFWENGQRIFQRSVKFMNAVRLVMHEYAFSGNKIYS